MSSAKAPALSALVTLEKEESREREKQRKAFIFVSPNLLQLYVRVQARAGVRGRGLLAQWQGAQWWHSSLSVDTHTDTHTQQHQGDSPWEYPSEVIQPTAALSHQCPKTGKQSIEECFHEPWHRRCTLYHLGTSTIIWSLSFSIYAVVFLTFMCTSRQKERKVMQLLHSVLWFPLLVWWQIFHLSLYNPSLKFGSIIDCFVYIFEGMRVKHSFTYFVSVCVIIFSCVCVFVCMWQTSSHARCIPLLGRSISVIGEEATVVWCVR